MFNHFFFQDCCNVQNFLIENFCKIVIYLLSLADLFFFTPMAVYDRYIKMYLLDGAFSVHTYFPFSVLFQITLFVLILGFCLLGVIK